MPYIPHTDAETQRMLDTLEAKKLSDLFDEIPAALRDPDLKGLPDGQSEMRVHQHMQKMADKDYGFLNFIGAGAYEHYIPAAVWDIVGRGEFMTAYTPYQAEASQGTLQVIYEFQSMMAALTGMEVSNASLYDGGSALAEACLMAVRAQRKTARRSILLPKTLHPNYAQTAFNMTTSQGVDLVTLPWDEQTGTINQQLLEDFDGSGFAAMVISQPNFFGQLEEVDALTDWAHQQGMFVIAVVNPTSLALLNPPGNWGESGADIVVGEGQPLGVPLSGGGPYFGFMCCRQSIVRQMPGRIVGKTLDLDGKPGFTLTLQAREQHIRRSKATSNICTNQGLAVTAATIYMSLIGGAGLAETAQACVASTEKMIAALEVIGLKPRFNGPRFHEVVIQMPEGAGRLRKLAAEEGVLAGVSLGSYFPELSNGLLLCATETKTDEDIQRLVQVLTACLKK